MTRTVRLFSAAALAGCLWFAALDARAGEGWSAGLGYQGVSADKGVVLQLSTPTWLGEGSRLFVEGAAMETAGVPIGESLATHENYLLLHAGWHWRGRVAERLRWLWLIGVGATLPSDALEKQPTPSGTVKTGLEAQLGGGLHAFLLAGVQLNLWNRASEFVSQPYYGRGTTVQLGVRWLFSE